MTQSSSRRHPRRCALAAAISFLMMSPAAPFAAQAAEPVPLVGPWSFRQSGASAGAVAEQTVSLPHDWSIGGERIEDAASGGGMGYFPTGAGTYEMTLDAPKHWTGKRVFLDFDGAYRSTTLSVNGVAVAQNASGYTPFSAEITQALQIGTANRIAIAISNEAQPNARWYTGSGLIRPVHLRVTDPIHVDLRDLAITTWHISEDGLMATMAIEAAVRNLSDEDATVTLDLAIVDPKGLPVAIFALSGTAAAGKAFVASPKLAIPHPQLWSPETPTLYRMVARSFVEGRLTDRSETTFGIRSIAVSTEQGLHLNGHAIELLGGNVHDDNGPLGAADYPDAAYRKARLLKAAGFNAVRTAHNPPSSAFLDACDRVGLLVINEAFDGWKKKKVAHDYAELFDANWEKDLDALVRRDRRHPSVIMWSIGNEVYERGSASGAAIAAAMRERIRALDTSRPITAGINGLGPKGDWSKLDALFASLDAAGYNYEIERHAADHERLPKRVMYSSESYLNDAFKSWKISTRQPYVIGDFVWSAIDYLGEAGIGRVFPPDEEAFPHWEGSHFPWHGAACGDIDITGWRKPVSHYRNIVWNRGEMLYAAVLEPTPDGRPWNLSGWATQPMLPSWTWPEVKRGQPLTVEVYSRHPKVRLYLNGKRIVEKPTGEAEQFKAVFEVPYRPGSLRAVGVSNGVEVETFTIQSAQHAATIELVPEKGEDSLPGASDEIGRLHFVRSRLIDAKGIWNPSRDVDVAYAVTGPAIIRAVGSGDMGSAERYGANPRSTYQGQALVVVERAGAGPITLTATAEGLKAGSVELQ